MAVQVHEEVLRLLTASVGKLSAHQLATYLQATLQHSRKSRKCVVDLLLVHICLLLKAHSSKLCITVHFPCCQYCGKPESSRKVRTSSSGYRIYRKPKAAELCLSCPWGNMRIHYIGKSPFLALIHTAL